MIGIPIIIDRYMAANTFSIHDGSIYADSFETVKTAFDHEFMRSCGVASAIESPRYIPLPDMNKPISLPLKPYEWKAL